MHEIKKILLENGEFIYPIPTDTVDIPDLRQHKVNIDVLRLDTLHPVISGNKWFKLKGWLETAIQMPGRRIVTFGGAWSNHIIAAAYAAKAAGLAATGIIRGERAPHLSDTLKAAEAYGMQLEFVSREQYGKRHTAIYLDELARRYPGACIIPEGGAGAPGVSGSKEILHTLDSSPYTHILCAVGTGTMFQGIAEAAGPAQTVLGLTVLKGLDPSLPYHTDDPHTDHHLNPRDISCSAVSGHHRLIHSYHFGGYARHTPRLLDFMNYFHARTQIPSDFVYTGKLFYGAVDMVRNDLFPPGSRLLLIHSGGLQGNRSLAPGVLHF